MRFGRFPWIDVRTAKTEDYVRLWGKPSEVVTYGAYGGRSYYRILLWKRLPIILASIEDRNGEATFRWAEMEEKP